MIMRLEHQEPQLCCPMERAREGARRRWWYHRVRQGWVRFGAAWRTSTRRQLAPIRASRRLRPVHCNG